MCFVLAARSGQSIAETRVIAALAGAYGVIGFTGNVLWNVWRPLGREPGLYVADALYFVGYVVMATIFCLSFRYLGGSFRSRRFWMDGGIIVVTLMAAFWAALLGPLRANGNQQIDLLFTLSYALVTTVLMAMAAMVCIQLPRLTAYPAVLWLVAASLIDTLWEVPWLTGWLADADTISPLYNLGDTICYTMIVSAAAVAPLRSSHACPGGSARTEQTAHNFLPALVVLLAISLVAGSLATSRAMDAWILVGLVVLCMSLIVTRQNSVRRELADLNRALAIREADARLTELVRQSKDLILVANATGVVRFASAAAESVAGVRPAELQGRPVAGILGRAHEASLERFVRKLVDQPATSSTMELTVDAKRGQARTIRIAGSNQFNNELIGGLTLTLSDVTEQRTLEREVLSVATQERVRIAGDIHDGVGQELAGIAMLLQSAATVRDPKPDSHRAELRAIVQQVNNAIRSARDLARGLSPIQVVQGSLRSALRRLGQEVRGGMAVDVDVDAQFDDRIADDLAADHVYRIAQEAVQNAIRHSDGSAISVSCKLEHGDLLLSITDNGKGIQADQTQAPGLGLRLMHYRAHMIRGRLTVSSLSEGGTCVQLRVPLVQARSGADGPELV